jgi:hypothetical protein
VINLFFFHAPGCSACASAEPALRMYAQRNPSVRVWRVDVSRFELPRFAQDVVTATPTYMLHRPRKQVVVRAGAMEREQELERWVGQKLLPGADVTDAEWHADE